ncbi:hypothetical protein MJ575_24365 [Klebsiella pneumoniae]|nr:hypothetical protein MJ575_24365 [Klebsiella pneumoniae]
MDYIDLYIYHIWDYNTPVIDVEALHTWADRRQGARDWHFNCCSGSWRRREPLFEHEGLTSFVSVQSHPSLIMREDERRLFELCAEEVSP